MERRFFTAHHQRLASLQQPFFPESPEDSFRFFAAFVRVPFREQHRSGEESWKLPPEREEAPQLLLQVAGESFDGEGEARFQPLVPSFSPGVFQPGQGGTEVFQETGDVHVLRIVVERRTKHPQSQWMAFHGPAHFPRIFDAELVPAGGDGVQEKTRSFFLPHPPNFHQPFAVEPGLLPAGDEQRYPPGRQAAEDAVNLPGVLPRSALPCVDERLEIVQGQQQPSPLDSLPDLVQSGLVVQVGKVSQVQEPFQPGEDLPWGRHSVQRDGEHPIREAPREPEGGFLQQRRLPDPSDAVEGEDERRSLFGELQPDFEHLPSPAHESGRFRQVAQVDSAVVRCGQDRSSLAVSAECTHQVRVRGVEERHPGLERVLPFQ